jgi:hypothetical protein
MADIGPRSPRMGTITWHRPGFSMEQLITINEVAELAEARLPTVRTWPRAYSGTWPAIVASVAGRGPQPQYYYDPAEVVAWLLEFRPGSKRGVEPARLERVIADIDDRIEHLQAVRARMDRTLERVAVR